MVDRLIVNCHSGEIREAPFFRDQLMRKAAAAQRAESREVERSAKDQARRDDLLSLETATPDQIGRIIARLLDA